MRLLLLKNNRKLPGSQMDNWLTFGTSLLRKTVQLLQQGRIQPITPQRYYEAGEVEDAFRYMQKGVHVGKIAVRMPKSWDDTNIKGGAKPIDFRRDASYLLIGGLGGLGKAISTWMIERGARSFVYLARSATSPKNHAFVNELRAQGASVTLVDGSVGVLEDVKKAIAASPSRIAGVLQMSLVLRDNRFLELTFDEWQGAVDPKVQGTWNIHNALGKTDVDFFVLFSSLSGATGMPGQGNYAAGNTFMNAFVQYRQQQGLAASVIGRLQPFCLLTTTIAFPLTSGQTLTDFGLIDIGPVAEIGYVAQNQELRDSFMRKFDAYEIPETELIDCLQYSIWKGRPGHSIAKKNARSYISESQIAIGLKSIKPLTDPGNRLNWRRDRRVGVMYNTTTTSASSGSGEDELLKAFLSEAEETPSILNTEEALDKLSRFIGTRLYTFMMHDLEDLDTPQTLAALGVDSLVTIEIRNWWRRTFVLEVSTLELLDAKTIAGLGKLAASGLRKKYEKEV